MSENYIMLNGKRVDLTYEQIEKLGLKKDCFQRVDMTEDYYLISWSGKVTGTSEFYLIDDEKAYDVGNYCTDYSLMQQRALHEILSRLLWRFSMQNDGDKLDWSKSNVKYFIVYDYHDKTFKIDYLKSAYGCTLKFSTEYFYSPQIAQRAIDEIVLPFMKEHPEFVW